MAETTKKDGGNNKGGHDYRKNKSDRRRKQFRDDVKPGKGYDIATCGTNDVKWYNHNEIALKDAAQLSFGNPLGNSFPLFNDVIADGTISTTYFPTASNKQRNVVPGIMAMRFVPGCGPSDSAQSAVNIAAKNLYSFIRHANSGHANYDSPDLMMYLLALDSAYMMYSYGVRAYRTAIPTSVRNRYLPRALTYAQGWDYDSIVAGLADFRAYLNVVAVKLSAFNAPNTMSIFARHSWLTSGVWSDSKDVEKSQLYLMSPQGYYTYNEAATPGKLDWNPLDAYSYSHTMTPTIFKTIMEGILQPLIKSEDIGIMSGDILKAFGPEKLYKVAYTQETDVLVPQFDELVLRQIQNTFIVGAHDNSGTNGNDITQDATPGSPTEGCILYNPRFNYQLRSASQLANTQVQCLNKRINAGEPAPSPETIAELTRNTVALNFNQSGTTANDYCWNTLAAGGTEVFADYCIVYIGADGAIGTLGGITHHSRMVTSSLQFIAFSSNFDFAPEYMEHSSTYVAWFWDCENYTTLFADTLKRIHDACVLSEFGVPVM